MHERPKPPDSGERVETTFHELAGNEPNAKAADERFDRWFDGEVEQQQAACGDKGRGDEEDLDLRGEPVDQRQRKIDHQGVDHIGRGDPEREPERFAQNVGDLLQRQSRIEVSADRYNVVRGYEAAQELPMKVGREQERDRGEGDECRQWRHWLVAFDLESRWT